MIFTSAQWHEDLDQLVQLVSKNHPKPFAFLAEEKFMAEAASLHAQIPNLDDKAIIVAMTALVASLDDGHTRLSLPRQHRSLAIQLEAGHSGIQPVNDERLEFTNLPVVFELFDDGLYIVEAAQGHARLVGRKVTAFGQMSTEEAINSISPLNFAENDSANRVWLPDRLALPEVLVARGIIDSSDEVELTLEGPGGVTGETLQPLARGDVDWSAGRLPDWIMPEGEKFSARFLANDRALYIRILEMEFMSDEMPSKKYGRLLAEASRKGTGRILVDLRNCIGGTNFWNTGIVRAFLDSEYQTFGTVYVLTGRQTFSAAALLVQDLEEFIEPIHVGEDVGARPSHYGDSRKFQLSHSGITLRVSSRFHASPWETDDERDTNPAHIKTPYTYAHYRGDLPDPAIAAALEHKAPASLAGQMAWLLEEGYILDAVFHYFRCMADPGRDAGEDMAELIALGSRLLAGGSTQGALYLFSLIVHFHPTEASGLSGLGRTYELMGEVGQAIDLYQQALIQDADLSEPKEGLRRLMPATPGK